MLLTQLQNLATAYLSNIAPRADAESLKMIQDSLDRDTGRQLYGILIQLVSSRLGQHHGSAIMDVDEAVLHVTRQTWDSATQEVVQEILRPTDLRWEDHAGDRRSLKIRALEEVRKRFEEGFVFNRILIRIF